MTSNARDSTQPLIVSLVGSSGVGKTTVLEQLIPLVSASGLRVGTVKHAPHGHQVDKIGSDSWRHRQAGAEAVLLAGADGAVLFLAPDTAATTTVSRDHHSPVTATEMNRITTVVGAHFNGIDIVLAEGFAPLHDPLFDDLVIEVRRRGVPAKFESVEAAKRAPVWLTITDEPSEHADQFGFDELAAVAARITEARIAATTS